MLDMDIPSPRRSPEDDCGCDEFLKVSRRGVLGGMAAIGGATMMFGGTAVTLSSPAAAASSTLGSNVIVVVSLRGAADGLSLVVPHTDPTYYLARPTIAIPRTSLLAADSTFGLHPQLAPLLPMWNAKQIAAIHGTGMAIPNRSHFAAMEAVEDASPGSAARVGWLNRLLGTDAITSPLQGIAVGGTPPASFGGPQTYMAVSDLDSGIAGEDPSDPAHPRLRSLQTVWGAEPTAMGAAWRTTLVGNAGLVGARRAPDHSGLYPTSSLGDALATVARTIRGNVGAQLITVDHENWDMHTNLGSVSKGLLVSMAGDFAKSIAAFFNDLGTARSRVTMVVLSEFGRRVQENASGGLDHGWGNVMWAMGAGVKGGYYGQVAPLANQLDADLQVTLDYRSVLAEVVTRRTSASVAKVFPQFAPERIGFMA